MTYTIYLSKKVQSLLMKPTKVIKKKRKFAGKRYLTALN